MNDRMGCARSERGQMTVVVAVAVVAMVAMGSFAVDVGAWLRAKRATQTVADAAALAAAQSLPQDPTTAQSLAQQYSEKNGGGLVKIELATATFPNDTISVRAQRTAPGFLSRVLGISSVNVGADSTARAFNLGAARYVAPLAVYEGEPMLSGPGCPCFGDGYTTTIDLETGRPSLGAFKVINVDGSFGGVGDQTLVNWLTTGYDGYMPLGWYYSNPGAKYNPQDFENAMLSRRYSELLFPVYDSVRAQGAGYEYRIVGWVGFYVKNYVARGAGGAVTGYFSRVVWEGLASESAEDFFGASVVKLVG